MTLDQADAALRTKGFYLSSISRLAENMGYIASSRPIKGPISNGDAGFGQTMQIAMERLIEVHGLKPKPARPLPQDILDLLA